MFGFFSSLGHSQQKIGKSKEFSSMEIAFKFFEYRAKKQAGGEGAERIEG